VSLDHVHTEYIRDILKFQIQWRGCTIDLLSGARKLVFFVFQIRKKTSFFFDRIMLHILILKAIFQFNIYIV